MVTKEEQRYGRNKETTVDHTYIQSGEYRKKFDKLTEHEKVNRLLYQKAKEMLLHRSGTLIEDMYWIDVESGEIVASVLDSKEEQKIVYSDNVKKIIRKKDNLITIHTHPFSMPPSIADFNSVYSNHYRFGVIICHDGRIYKYYAKERLKEDLQKLYMAIYFKKGYNEEKAQLESLRMIQRNYDMNFEEVS